MTLPNLATEMVGEELLGLARLGVRVAEPAVGLQFAERGEAQRAGADHEQHGDGQHRPRMGGGEPSDPTEHGMPLAGCVQM
ncbi:MAG: hypothetical protein LC635_01330 [Pseudonocardiaceae bacterium]|nr:hypothetical protein [Pseudonocardiaceae bacterium]